MGKKILITGTNTGFGRMFADTLLKNGHTVVAAMRDVDGRNKEAADGLREAGASRRTRDCGQSRRRRK